MLLKKVCNYYDVFLNCVYLSFFIMYYTILDQKKSVDIHLNDMTMAREKLCFFFLKTIYIIIIIILP